MQHPTDKQRPLQAFDQQKLVECPCCERETPFLFIGEQVWPERVSQRMGIEPTVTLWDCTLCGTTITDITRRE